jgi:hypothetical protein
MAKLMGSALLIASLVTTTPPMALADEYGVETEAPTFFTGESIMVRNIE